MLITRRTTLLGLLSTTSFAFLPSPAFAQSFEEIEAAARKEGEIVSLGCPTTGPIGAASGRRSPRNTVSPTPTPT